MCGYFSFTTMCCVGPTSSSVCIHTTFYSGAYCQPTVECLLTASCAQHRHLVESGGTARDFKQLK